MPTESDVVLSRPSGELAHRGLGIAAEPGHREPAKHSRNDAATSRIALPTERSPGRPTGADTGSFPTRSSSGKGGPAGCTTALRYTRRPHGDWLIERLAP